MIINRMLKQKMLRITMLNMKVARATIVTESEIKSLQLRNAKAEEEKEEPKAKRAKIEMETSSNSIQDSMSNKEEETEEAKAKRVKIEIETELKAIRNSVTKVKKAEDKNMRLVEELDLCIPQTSTDSDPLSSIGPIEFKSVSDPSLDMASLSLEESLTGPDFEFIQPPISPPNSPDPEPARAQPNNDQWLELGPMYIFATPSFADLPPISP